MKKIISWQKFFESSYFILSEKDKDVVGYEILLACRSVWGYLKVDSITKFGITISASLLRKTKNNRLVIEFVKKTSDAKSVEELINWIKSNTNDLFHPDGKYFREIIAIVVNSSKLGSYREEKAIECIKKYFLTKGQQIEVTPPSEIDDIDGYDFFFEVDGVRKSAQVKTLLRVDEGRSRFFVYSKGHVTDFDAQYLIVVNDLECYIFDSTNKFMSDVYYSIPKEGLIWSGKF